MSNHTRRQFLGLVASLLTLLDAVRRFFQPPEVVKDHVDDWPAPNTGPYFDYFELGPKSRYTFTRRILSKADAERIYWLKPGTLDSL